MVLPVTEVPEETTAAMGVMGVNLWGPTWLF